MSQASEMVRKNFKEGDDIRDAGLRTPEDVMRMDDILYGTDTDWQRLDVYRPKASEGETLPVIVSVHGGGWVYGDKERYQYYCMDLARRGFAVINFTYRLAPEFKFPAALEDVNLVFSWVLDHSGQYGFDKKRTFAVGDSAGAHYLGLYAGLCSNSDGGNSFGIVPPEGFVPTAVALNCGAYQISMDDGGLTDGLTRELMKDLLPGQGTKDETDDINVLSRITPQFPPTFLMTCTGDFLLSQAPLLQAKLLENTVPHVFRFYGSADKEPLGHVFHLNIKAGDAGLCNDEECGFFRRFIE
ncbi:MAG: alpha/beta hydrolase [Clostridiales bacterium]|nr:alpha/beta hydrolase [Clostridiales bacterium]